LPEVVPLFDDPHIWDVRAERTADGTEVCFVAGDLDDDALPDGQNLERQVMRGAGKGVEERCANCIRYIGVGTDEELELYRLPRSFERHRYCDRVWLAADSLSSWFLEYALEEASRTSIVYDAAMNPLATQKRPVLRLDGNVIRPATVSAHPRFPGIETALEPFGVHA